MFQTHRKLFGWLLLHAARLPTVAGMVITDWSPEVEAAVRRVAARWQWLEVLIRSDAPLETASSPRGGYIVALDSLALEIRPLLNEGRALFLLEPVSPLDDLYSISLEPDRGWRDWLLEIVGPGFDASDLKRGDVTPHEQLRLRLEEDGVHVTERLVASPVVQAAGHATRLRKAATLLGCDSDQVAHELRCRGETMLLDQTTYPEIPKSLVSLAVQYAARLRRELRSRDLEDHGVTLSMSFIGRDARPVFWDVVWARTKYLGTTDSQHFTGPS